ncbi:Tumor necrosis factor receptor superfamily member 14 [Merluccius polli]|uniref:Tumor necrosis factor receptor superfamily member 14 n=1 Tax=Merluccius polli TaxID=89951 RepID=A0AA47NN04_MERPO|nr:Tumor necrosis factor receptor superfamily member 14 [Merluccius polli]
MVEAHTNWTTMFLQFMFAICSVSINTYYVGVASTASPFHPRDEYRVGHLAQRHMVCSPGQYISQGGTADKDTECLQCTNGTFSDGTSTSCQPHTKCESVGLELIKPGRDSTDSECGEHGSNTAVVAIATGVTLAVLLVIALKAIGGKCYGTLLACIMVMLNDSDGVLTCYFVYPYSMDTTIICENLTGSGMYVKRHCTEFTSTSCKPCTEGTFQDNMNGRERCFSCTNCDAGLGLKVKKFCTVTSDTVCENLDGYFCIDSNRDGCIAAQRHMVCSPGQHVSQRGTADKDTECLQCTNGTFSDGTSTSCQPHTICESVGLKQIQPGSDSTDSECGEQVQGSNTGLVAGIITGLVLLLCIALALMALWRKKIIGNILL